MAASQIIGDTYSEGLKAPHYFNRRLLTAEDLKADQQATLGRLALLGRAAGHGVVEGLEVEQFGSTILRVGAGLGINRSGNPIRLPQLATLNFSAPPASTSADRDGGRFHDCAVSSGAGGRAPSQGAYLLSAAPISRLEGSAAVKAAAGSTSTAACAAQWEVEGLQFRAIRLDGFDQESEITPLNRRNRLAHFCYGSASFPALERDYLGLPEQYGGLAALGAQELTACDLPLAVFFWNGSTISDVDTWSVRRRLVQSGALSSFSALIGDRRSAEGQARFMQFQTQLASLQASVSGTINAEVFFPLLPPAGLLRLRLPASLLRQVAQPLASELLAILQAQLGTFPIFGISLPALLAQRAGQLAERAVQLAVQTGMEPSAFFGNHPLRFGLVDPDAIDDVVRASWYHNAFAVLSAAPVDLLVPFADVVQLLAPAMLQATSQVLGDLANFGFATGFLVPFAETYLRQRIAGLTYAPVAAVTLAPAQPVALFVKRLRETQFVD